MSFDAYLQGILRDNQRAIRIDFILLPAIFFLTWLLVAAGGEALARLYYPEQQMDSCQVSDNHGSHFKPDCHSRIKMFESGWIDSSYNDCGYRSDRSCKSKPAGGLRVAILGTSISRGYWVPYKQSLAGRLEHDLTASCGRPVDTQTVAMADSIDVTDSGVIPLWHHIADRVPEAIALKPDALVLVMTAFDLASYEAMPGEDRPPIPKAPPSGLAGLVKNAKDFVANDSRLIEVLRHVAYRNADRYAVHELAQGDSSDYLRQPFTPAWSLRLRVADDTIGRMAQQAHQAGLPLIVVLMPSRAQAALAADGADRHGAHPFAFGRALSAIADRDKVDFVDLTRQIRHLPDPSSLFFTINGHPNGDGAAALASAVEPALVDDVPGFSGCGAHHLGS